MQPEIVRCVVLPAHARCNHLFICERRISEVMFAFSKQFKFEFANAKKPLIALVFAKTKLCDFTRWCDWTCAGAWLGMSLNFSERKLKKPGFQHTGARAPAGRLQLFERRLDVGETAMDSQQTHVQTVFQRPPYCDTASARTQKQFFKLLWFRLFRIRFGPHALVHDSQMGITFKNSLN